MVTNLGAVTAGTNFAFKNGQALTLMGNVTANNIVISTAGGAAGARGMTLGADVTLKSVSAIDASEFNIELNTGVDGTGFGTAGIFTSGGFTLSTHGQNIKILAGGFAFTGNTGGKKAINAIATINGAEVKGLVLTGEAGRTRTKTGDIVLGTAAGQTNLPPRRSFWHCPGWLVRRLATPRRRLIFHRTRVGERLIILTR